MANKHPIQRLRIRRLKNSDKQVDRNLDEPKKLTKYRLKGDYDFTGSLYLANPMQGNPPWLEFVQTGLTRDLGNLTNRTNAAVLFIESRGNRFALAFGHGRHLLKPGVVAQDFGIKVALNAIAPGSLRSVDAFTLEEQAIQKRVQASRAGSVGIFGLDVGRDILRAITGTPRLDTGIESVAGSDSVLSVGVRTDFGGLGACLDKIYRIYKKKTYKRDFPWVDHISRVMDPLTIDALNKKLLTDVTRKAPDSTCQLLSF